MATAETIATKAREWEVGEDHGNRKNYGKPDHVDSDISFSRARSLAVNYGLVGYKALPRVSRRI
jgi:hypothetical protein